MTFICCTTGGKTAKERVVGWIHGSRVICKDKDKKKIAVVIGGSNIFVCILKI